MILNSTSSKFVLPLLGETIPSSPLACVLEVRDAYGNLAAGREADIAIDASTLGRIPVYALGNGLYGFKVQHSIRGNYSVSISVLGQALSSGPFRAVIIPDAIDPRTSKVTSIGTGLSASVCGSESQFTITAYDEFGNLVNTYAGDTKFTWAWVGAATTMRGTATNNGDGTFSASYTPTKAGAYTLHVRFGDSLVHVDGTVQMVASPGSLNAVHSTLSAPSSTLVAGTVATATLKARDVFGNDIQVGGATSSLQTSFTLDDASTKTTAIVDNGDGTYAISFTPTLANQGGVLALSDGSTSAAPISFSIEPAQSDAQSCVMTSGSLSTTAGVRAEFMIQIKDSVGPNLVLNRRVDDMLTAVVVTSSSSSSSTSSATVVYDSSGKYKISYAIEVAGTHYVEVKLRGSEVQGSPFQVSIQGAATEAQTSALAASALVSTAWRAGVTRSIMITSKDAFSNVVYHASDSFNAAIVGPVNVAGSVTDNTDGTYTASFTPTVSGFYALQVQHSATGPLAVSNQFKRMTVLPDITAGAHCVAVGSGLDGAIANASMSFAIQAFDRFDNAQTADVDTFKVSIAEVGGGECLFNWVAGGVGGVGWGGGREGEVSGEIERERGREREREREREGERERESLAPLHLRLIPSPLFYPPTPTHPSRRHIRTRCKTNLSSRSV